ncbi:EcoA type I restriction-modification enzyme R subunit [Streptococcus suis]|nr:restriction endonuclease subunit R [Streptococcus suis]CYY92226.1 EcoA type I restriction-modification enzyme R subunit [Streptococcus suis]CZA08969.1 EcoA type I restriction-modification enzyme R subunit [Streptococcus suis]
MVVFIKSKKEMSEEDIKANFITPAILSKGWKNGEQIAYEEYFTDGRIEVRGDKGRRKEGKNQITLSIINLDSELQSLKLRIISIVFVQVYNKRLNMVKFWMFLSFIPQMVMGLLSMTELLDKRGNSL